MDENKYIANLQSPMIGRQMKQILERGITYDSVQCSTE